MAADIIINMIIKQANKANASNELLFSLYSLTYLALFRITED